MDLANVAGILISVVAALGAWASSRASSKASTSNSRTEAEKEAYDRARKMDVSTIERQDAELLELRQNYDAVVTRFKAVEEQNEHLNADVKRVDADNRSLHDENQRVLADNALLRAEVARLRQRLTRLERGLHPEASDLIQERREDLVPSVYPEPGLDSLPVMPEEANDGGNEDEVPGQQPSV